MFASLCLRSKVALQSTCESFLNGLPYQSLFPAAKLQNTTMAERPSTTLDYYSSASAPNLRSTQPAMEMMDRPRSSDGDANVKVVVRVRKFIKRGKNVLL
jgi:hypothetical protein